MYKYKRLLVYFKSSCGLKKKKTNFKRHLNYSHYAKE